MSNSTNTPKTWTVLEILQWTAAYFEKHGVDSARLSAELLLCEVLSIERLRLYLDFERLLSASELKIYRSMIERRVKHREPLQYILGSTDFYTCNFLVDSRVLIPRPETEQLVECAIELIASYSYKTVLDVGTGSGCIAISVAKECPHADVVATDVSDGALELASRNAERNVVRNVEFLKHDIVQEKWVREPVDLLLSNPPYISAAEYAALEPEVRVHEPKTALTDGADGLGYYRRFQRILPSLCKPGASFVFECGFGESEAIAELFKDYQLRILSDYSGIPRLIVGKLSSS